MVDFRKFTAPHHLTAVTAPASPQRIYSLLLADSVPAVIFLSINATAGLINVNDELFKNNLSPHGSSLIPFSQTPAIHSLLTI